MMSTYKTTPIEYKEAIEFLLPRHYSGRKPNVMFAFGLYLDDSLKALASELGVAESVRFLGQVANGRRYFKVFDVFALTSDHEPFGMVLLEAMVAGVPVICSDCGGGREVVEGVGALFPLRGIANLAECLVRASRLTVNGLAEKRNAMVGRLHSLFIDAAGAECFWHLSLLKSVAN